VNDSLCALHIFSLSPIRLWPDTLVEYLTILPGRLLMSKEPKRRPRRLRREALVFAHLEHVSKDLLLRHPDVVREFIGRNTGVYALYRKNRLYYVGLASALRHRLTAHGKNRHGKLWDHFSIYLTIKDQHLREIEALLLRIAKPPGAKQSGKLAQSKDMKRQMMSAIRNKSKRETSSLFNSFSQIEDPTSAKTLGETDLIRLLPGGARLRGTNKGKSFTARARSDGTVRFKGRVYSSLSLAAKAAIKRSINGWWFWQIERGKGNWVRLTKIRKAGTPIYAR
jgi:Restriction Enzyme Adenine Methylase Associated